jgi:hypothetical protein
MLYAQKFEEVNKSINQSTEIFGKMKEEISKVKTYVNIRETQKSTNWRKKMQN